MNEEQFRAAFVALTGNEQGHFPWQWALYKKIAIGDFPSSCNLPTGLGKTSVVALWLIALAHNPDKLPRRLVYVVNRRTVVDQTTEEVVKYRRRIGALNDQEPLKQRLDPLAISTLRGQFADNREWSADPSRPAVICGTVDMIGSRLLFSGYGVGFKGKPLHAGFLGQDVLLVHDEAHLEPAFQKLIEEIRDEQKREPAALGEKLRLNVMELTATSRGQGEQFRLTPEDYENTTVIRRIRAKKGIAFHRIPDEKQTADTVARRALKRAEENEGAAILVFLQFLEDVQTVQKQLLAAKHGVQVLTGTLRGLERDRLATRDDIFARFLPESSRPLAVTPRPGTVILICTGAGEVGVNISADHLVCDLTPLDSMAQRFGRVNRFGGDNKQAFIDLVHPTGFDTKDKLRELARERSLTLLGLLPPCDWDATRHDASPNALSVLRERDDLPFAFEDAFAPPPIILPVSDILFDAWALTTIRSRLPGRPIVEPYLHGISGWEPPETHVAWREEVGVLRLKFENEAERREREKEERKRLAKFAAELLEDYPLKPHELLREPSYRAFKHFQSLAKRRPEEPVWLLDEEGKVGVLTLAELADKDEKDRVEGKTVLLPPSAGGLENGMLAGNSDHADDMADEWYEDAEQQVNRRIRVWDNDPEFDSKTDDMRLIRRIDIPTEGEDAESRSWYWFELPKDGDSDGSKSNKLPVLWSVHVGDVVRNAADIVSRLPLSEPLKEAIILAARFHDHGKRRKLFQRILGNLDPNKLLAKSGKRGGHIPETYRHEFGSLLDVEEMTDFRQLDDELKDVVRHLIAVHHGRGRPHFPADEAFDPDRSNVDTIAAGVPRRFARLQRKYGRWGLAYLESLLRAADYAASAKPSAFVEGNP
jgi:CRISPR-associated endonuclease/helicase Cas3